VASGHRGAANEMRLPARIHLKTNPHDFFFVCVCAFRCGPAPSALFFFSAIFVVVVLAVVVVVAVVVSSSVGAFFVFCFFRFSLDAARTFAPPLQNGLAKSTKQNANETKEKETFRAGETTHEAAAENLKKKFQQRKRKQKGKRNKKRTQRPFAARLPSPDAEEGNEKRKTKRQTR